MACQGFAHPASVSGAGFCLRQEIRTIHIHLRCPGRSSPLRRKLSSNQRCFVVNATDNAERDAWAAHCETLRARGEPTLPSTIAREQAINPFLRCEQPGVIEAVAAHAGRRPPDTLECLAALRVWKDRF